MIQYNQLDSPLSPQSFTSIIARRIRLVLFSFIAIFATVAVVTFTLPPVYEATARLIVSYQDDYEKMANPGTVRAPYDIIATEVAILKTRAIIEPVVSTLGLAVSNDITDVQHGHQQAVARLTKNLSVKREKDTSILIISYADQNPERAAQIVNESIRQYLLQRPALSKDESAVRFLNQQIKELEQRIDSLEIKSQIYKSETRVLAPEKQTQILFSTLAEFDQEITRVRTERIAKESRLQVIKQQLNQGQRISIPVTEASNSLSKMEYLNNLRKTELDLQLRKNVLAQKYTKKHPDMATVLQDIENIQTKIDKEIQEIIQLEETDVKAVQAQERELIRTRSQVARSIADLSKNEYELGKHTIGIDELKNVHATLIEQREHALAAARKKEHLVGARLIEEAVPPFQAARPNKKLVLAFGIMLASVLSFSAAFFVEYFDHAVHTAEDAQNCLGLPVLAIIQDVHPRALHQLEHKQKAIAFKPLD
ncbi:GumC family protein [candidate division KSB1 bacterium]|nr:GumC family protein [candidate division KSB1 bacterium]